MRYALVLHMNPATWESLSEDDRTAVFNGHERFTREITESGEFVETRAYAEPPDTATVRVRGGAPEVTDGPYRPTEEFVCGYYVVECPSKKRAIELAARIPDAQYTAVEVRPVVHEATAQA